MMHRAILGLALAWMLCAYGNGTNAAYVYEDDRWLGALEQPLSAHFPGRYLTQASYAAQARWSNSFNVQAFHRGNVAIHAATGVALYAVVTAVAPPLAGAVATWLFWLHPANSESVQYVAGRADLLLTLFALLSLAIGLRSRTWAGMSVAVTCALLSACSKEYGVVALPLLVFSVWLLRPTWRPVASSMSYVAKASYVLIAWVACVAIAAWAPLIRGLFAFGVSLQPVAVAELMSLAVWPFGRLTIDHDPQALSALARLAYLGGVVIAMSALAVSQSHVARWILGWSVLAIGVRAFVPTGDFPTEHHLYLFMAGACAGAGVLVHALATYSRSEEPCVTFA